MRLCDVFNWKARAEAYDEYITRTARQSLETADGKRALDIAATVRDLALTAAIAAWRSPL